MGIACIKPEALSSRSTKYVPSCTALTENFFSTHGPNSNEAALFFSSLRVAIRSMLHCSKEEAEEFLIGSCQRSVKTSVALDTFLSESKYSKMAPDLTLAKIMQVWMKYDKDNSGDLSYAEMKRLVVGLSFSKNLTREILKPFRDDSLRTITFAQFSKVYADAISFKELGYIFQGLGGGGGTITRDVFASFVRDVQGEDWDDETLDEKLALMGCVNANHITESNFLTYVTSPHFSAAMDEKKAREIYHDMDQNICSYFLYSSHNTYLTGDQLTSKSSSQMYKKVLVDGCRCVELDCWNGSHGEPVVYHGHTRTSRIPFEECIGIIRQYAFCTSCYPVILSLEVHTSLEQQDRMADILCQGLGSLLFRPPWGASEKPTIIFSPNNLRNKILIKAKRGEFPVGEPGVDKDEDDDGGLDEEGAWAYSMVGASNADYIAVKKNRKEAKKEVVKISEKLSAIVSIESSGYKGVKDLSYLKDRQPYHCSSYSEGKAKSIARENHDAFVCINDTYLSRVFPAGSRIDSSNYNPQLYWECGCQIVALNWQSKNTLSWRLNRCFFRDNGRCGYILKPDYLRPLTSPDAATPEKQRSLTVEVISGSSLPHARKSDIADPFVTVFLQGPDVDTKPKSTHTIHNNGFHPVWRGTGQNEWTWTINRWSMTILVMQVYDRNKYNPSVLLAEAIIPLRMIRGGFRKVFLHDPKGYHIPGSFLLCRINYADV